MLQINSVSKSFGSRTVLKNVSLTLSPGDRAALVGPNGAGKSTLLGIAAGVARPDSGSVETLPGTRIGYLPQATVADQFQPVIDALLSFVPGILDARQAVQRMTSELQAAGSECPEELSTRYADTVERYAVMGGYDLEERVDVELAQAGLNGVSADRRVDELSGGQRTRLCMAGLSLAHADVLLLDEPTNHLDIEGIEWLESFIGRFKGAVLFVSHDRTFLDRVATRVIEIDPGTGAAAEYRGSFQEYAAEKERRSSQEWSDYQRQQQDVQRMKQDVARMKQRAQQIEGAGRRFSAGHDHYNRVASKVARLGVTRERRLEKFLGSDERVEKPRERWKMGVEFGPTERGGSMVARLKDVSMSYGSVRVINRVSVELDHGERVAIVGPNGTGKTTILRLLLGEIGPVEGTVRLRSGIQPGYLPQQLEELPGDRSPLQVLRERHDVTESDARAFLHRFLFTPYTALSSVGTLSHGERVRLALALIVASGANLLLLDEPMNHLDMDSRQKLAEALSQFEGTIVAATHDRAFVAEFATRAWRLSAGEHGAALTVE